MQLNRIDDPRDWIGKTRKRELVEIARSQGIEISETMPADDYTDPSGRLVPGIRTMLRQRGVKPVPLPPRQLGKRGRHETRPLQLKQPPPPSQPPPAAPPPQATPSEWDEFQRWKASQGKAQVRPPRLKPRPQSEINRLRDECKRLGIKMDRRDRMDDLKAKIAAHGQNAPEQRQ